MLTSAYDRFDFDGIASSSAELKEMGVIGTDGAREAPYNEPWNLRSSDAWLPVDTHKSLLVRAVRLFT
jgi:hypothetical protein